MSSAAEAWHVYICVVEIRPQFDDLTTCQHNFFCDRIYHHLFWHANNVLTNQIGVVMNVALINVCLLHIIQKTSSTMAYNEH